MALRSTFRSAAGGVAWQKQLRDRHLSEGSPFDAPPRVKAMRVRAISRATAKQVILKYEWLGTMAPTSLHFGGFFGSLCCGVTCVDVGGNATAGATVHVKWGIDRLGLRTLARGACVHWAPPGANSRLVSWTAKLCARQPGAKLMIAYADTDAGEIGTIYQACGWPMVGRTSRGADAEYVSPAGRIINSQTVGGWARKSGMRYSKYARVLIAKGWRTQRSNPKIVYVCVLDKSDRRLVDLVASRAQPYPKRPGSSDGAAPAPQAGEGGSNPTSGLNDTEARG